MRHEADRDTSKVKLSDESRAELEFVVKSGQLGFEDGRAWIVRKYRNAADAQLVEINEPLDLNTGKIIEVVDIPGQLSDEALSFLREKTGWKSTGAK